MGVDSVRGKRRWYVAAVGGLAGLTGVAAVGVLTAGAAAAGPSVLTGQEAASTLQVTRPVADGSKDLDGQKMGDSEDHGKDGSEDGDSHEPGTQIRNNTAETGGGAIYNTGLLTVEGVRVSYNDTTANFGGGVENDGGVATVSRSRVDHNTAGSDSGGIDSEPGSITQVKDSWVTDNTSGGTGGGIGNFDGSLYVQRTTVRHNTGPAGGGGISNFGGRAVVDDSKVDENTTYENGGGVVNGEDGGQFVLRDSTVDQNRAIGETSQGGGIANFAPPDPAGSVTLTNTRVSENFATNPPGGILSGNNQVTVDDDSVIIKNRPTNCQGNPVGVVIPNCFG
ncbi:hypothetical protein [Actinopolymorpha pittospori]